jgi:hypothetical protein
MSITLDKGHDRPYSTGIEVPYGAWLELLQGGTVEVDGRKLTLDDAPFFPVFPETEVVERGGPGSGHFGHEGRPGEVGGSKPSKGKRVDLGTGFEAVKIEDIEETFRANNELHWGFRRIDEEVEFEGITEEQAEKARAVFETELEEAVVDAVEKFYVASGYLPEDLLWTDDVDKVVEEMYGEWGEEVMQEKHREVSLALLANGAKASFIGHADYPNVQWMIHLNVQQAFSTRDIGMDWLGRVDDEVLSPMETDYFVATVAHELGHWLTLKAGIEDDTPGDVRPDMEWMRDNWHYPFEQVGSEYRADLIASLVTGDMGFRNRNSKLTDEQLEHRDTLMDTIRSNLEERSIIFRQELPPPELITIYIDETSSESVMILPDEIETDQRVFPKDGPIERGGPGSGHFGHEGRPGEVGGSLPSDGAEDDDLIKDMEGMKTHPVIVRLGSDLLDDATRDRWWRRLRDSTPTGTKISGTARDVDYRGDEGGLFWKMAWWQDWRPIDNQPFIPGSRLPEHRMRTAVGVAIRRAHYFPDEIVERGGPGSGHFGHEGRPGQVGGSKPSGRAGLPSLKDVRWFTQGPHFRDKIEHESLEEALEAGDGRIEIIDDERLLWASIVFAKSDQESEKEFFRAGYTRDQIDPAVEIQHMIGVYDHMVEVLSDPENAEFIEQSDRHGEFMLSTTQEWLERLEQLKAEGTERLELLGRRGEWPSLNMIVTNRQDNAGAGSTNIGALGGKVFWVPVTLDEAQSVLKDTHMTFGVSGPYVLVHELHHGFGSGTEFDQISNVIAADYYMKHPDAMNSFVEQSMVQELNSMTFSGTRRAAGEFKTSILRNREAMGWLYSRNKDYFTEVFNETRIYAETGDPPTPRSRGWTWTVDEYEKKLQQWAKKYQ